MTDRIQRQRTAGWRMPANAVYVGRPTRWGNPFAVTTKDRDGRAAAVALYRAWLCEPGQQGLVAAIRAELRGHDLACWCPLDQPCHADALLEVASHD